MAGCLRISRCQRLPLKGRRSGERDLRYDCVLPTAHCLVPTAYCICAGRDATCATPAHCLLHLREAGWKGHFGGVVALDKMSPLTGKERTSTLKIERAMRECH